MDSELHGDGSFPDRHDGPPVESLDEQFETVLGLDRADDLERGEEEREGVDVVATLSPVVEVVANAVSEIATVEGVEEAGVSDEVGSIVIVG